MKNRILIIIGIVTIIIGILLFLLTGGARNDVVLGDFSVSEDGKIMTLKVGVASSSGYIRKMKRTSGSMNGYYTFYSTYGINSKNGAKNTFEINLDDNMDEIYFYTGNKGYRLELIKSLDSQKWVKLNYAKDRTFKLKLTNKNKIVKVGINTGSQDNNYFEYSDKDTIEKIYRMFSQLETEIVSKTLNPIDAEEIYMVGFYDDGENTIIDTYVEVYRKNGKYFVEQSYNGIYEITLQEFNLIKSYVE